MNYTMASVVDSLTPSLVGFIYVLQLLLHGTFFLHPFLGHSRLGHGPHASMRHNEFYNLRENVRGNEN